VTDVPATEPEAAVPEAETGDPVHAFIKQTVAEHPVVVFMKGTPDAPRCGFSALVVQILDHVGAPFVGIDVLQDESLRAGVKAFSDWPTIPQLYVKGEFVGGSDIVREMYQAGELTTFLTEKGVVEAQGEA
jgi:monothiol glutaredoxin